jgi:hypothetical protein
MDPTKGYEIDRIKMFQYSKIFETSTSSCLRYVYYLFDFFKKTAINAIINEMKVIEIIIERTAVISSKNFLGP